MNEQEFKDKTQGLAIRVIRMVESLPKSATTDVIGKQLLRSSTSGGANYRAACRAKSSADMIAKLAIVEEEADESMYWIELLIELNLVTSSRVADLMKELNEIVAITVSSIKTLRIRKRS
jgi:four helix bundle protein